MIHHLKAVQFCYRLRRLGLMGFLAIQCLILFYDFWFDRPLSTPWDEIFLLLAALNPALFFQKCPYCGRRLKRREIMEMREFYCPHCRNQDLYGTLPAPEPLQRPWPPESLSPQDGKRRLRLCLAEFAADCGVAAAVFILFCRPTPPFPAWNVLTLASLAAVIARRGGGRAS